MLLLYGIPIRNTHKIRNHDDKNNHVENIKIDNDEHHGNSSVLDFEGVPALVVIVFKIKLVRTTITAMILIE